MHASERVDVRRKGRDGYSNCAAVCSGVGLDRALRLRGTLFYAFFLGGIAAT